MIICFHCDRKTKEIMDDLIESGQYQDYAEIISVAVANLSVLEAEIGNDGSLMVRADSDYASDNMLAPHRVTNPNADRSAQGELKEIPTTYQTRQKKLTPSIPRAFLLHDDDPSGTNPVARLPDDVWLPEQEVPLDRWLFGQYNRLLPAKASCRALTALLHDKTEGIAIEEAAQYIAHEAAVLGDFLKHHDNEHEIGRDDLLSTAFPTTDNKNEKSRLRYANQFVGDINSEGQISGLLIGLKLINSVGRSHSTISLTKPGWELAMLPNPVLDRFQNHATEKFSREEIRFLLNHISTHVPAEDYAYRATLLAIESGADTPDSVNDALQEQVPITQGKKLSTSFLSSQRSGAISRMTDLKLVERIRDGVRVRYALTQTGREFMTQSTFE